MKYFHLLSLVSLAAAKRPCKCTFGQKCWPSDAQFQDLSSQVSQPLLHPVPPESACYPISSPSGNCSDVQANALTGGWRSDQPGNMQSTNFETHTFKNGTISACYLNTTLGFPCEQGSIAVVGVDVRSVSDAQAAIKFASDHNLRLTIKNTGHCYLGRSTARGSFFIWTHHLKNITYNENFTPAGVPTNESYKAFTLGAGVQWSEVYDVAEQNGRTIVGGISAGGSVGAVGGWIQGGGHGALSALHGLGVDNVLEFTVVTAKGEYLTVNAHQHPDLFWALRGGGGGTYVLVLSATYKTYDPLNVVPVLFSANFTSPEAAKSVLTEWVKLNPILSDKGWGGYGRVSPTNIQFLYIAPNTSAADANATTLDFVTHAQKATNDAYAAYLPEDSFYGWYKQFFAAGEQVGTNVELGSRLISRDISTNNPEEAAEILLAINDGVAFNFVGGGAVNKADPESTGLNPNWRKAIALLYVTGGWSDGTPTSVIQGIRKTLSKQVDLLDGLSPDSATYYNEAFLYERNFKKSFFGPHYNKLKSIKTKYDPKSLFIVAAGVGSDDWDADLNCPA